MLVLLGVEALPCSSRMPCTMSSILSRAGDTGTLLWMPSRRLLRLVNTSTLVSRPTLSASALGQPAATVV